MNFLKNLNYTFMVTFQMKNILTKLKNNLQEENFIYKGPLYKNKIKTLSKYDVLIYPSLSENFGLGWF